MRSILIFTLFTFITTLGFSQDVIFKRNGEKIEAKILEITITTIKYKRFDQQDGPLRYISISEVKEIIYEDGTWDKFEEKPVAERPAARVEEVVPRETKDHIIGNGFFIEGMIGWSWSSTYILADQVAIQMRLGQKWYFGSKENKWRPGIQVTYLRLGIYHDMYQPQDYTLSLANLGFANIFKFKDHHGLEINANFGFNVQNFAPPPFSDYDGDPGIIYGAEIKYRYKSLAVGLDYSRINTFYNNNNRDNRNILSLTIGRKF